MEYACPFDDLTDMTLRDASGTGPSRTAAYPNERCRQQRPSGSVSTPVREAPINLFVKRGMECGPAPLAPAAPRVVPVGNPPETVLHLEVLNGFKCFI